MPSVNLIWEHRLVRSKQQRIATLLLALVGIGLLVIGEEIIRTHMRSAYCKAEMRKCEDRIKKAEADAKLNAKLQAQIASIRPKVALVEEAQKITLRWVNLLGELDASVPDTSQVYLSQCGYSAVTGASNQKVEPGTVGTLSIAGAARNYDLISMTMRRLTEQPHIRTVRLTQAQATADQGIRFSLRAQFCDEEGAHPPAAETGAKKGRDPAEALQDAGKKTVLNRTAPSDEETE